MAGDLVLEQKIQDLLNNDPTLSAYGVKARVNQGLVTLQGVVDVLTDKKYAEEKVRSISGVQYVENDLVLCTDGGIDDEDVAFEVAEELMADPAVPDSIGVKVNDGHVRLVGTADTRAEANAAVSRAQTARGVVDVINEIHLSGENEIHDATLANQVRNMLERLGIRRSIGFNVENGIVFLKGHFDEPGVYSAVEEALAHIPGIKAIRNQTEPLLDLSDRVVVDFLDIIGKDPFLTDAEISYFWEDGQFVVEGEVDSIETKKALEGALQDLISSQSKRIMIENRVRLAGD